MTDPTPTYAWCFSHGRMHTFYSDREPWCTAMWAPVSGDTEEAALAAKRERYGDAQFIHHLPLGGQAEVHRITGRAEA